MRQPNSMKRNQNRLHSMMVVTTFQFILWCSTYCFMYNNVVAATNAVTCVVEYSMNAKPVQLSKEQIDDGYCDCVWTGDDEPTTNACSGFASWPGTTLLQPQSQQDSSHHLSFQCPQQRNLKLSVSKVNDGICDCCDGADETSNSGCTDNCADILKAEQEAKRLAIEKFTVGYEKRQSAVTEYRKYVKQTRSDIQVQSDKLEQVQNNIIVQQKLIATSKKRFITNRILKYKEMRDNHDNAPTYKMLYDMFQTFTLNELQWFITYVCQLSGEMDGSKDDTIKTCVPLRLAGLDYGMVWESGTYRFKELESSSPEAADDNNMATELADMILHNIEPNNSNNAVWTPKMISKKGSPNKKMKKRNRRLSEEEDEDYDHEVEEEDEDYDQQENYDEEEPTDYDHDEEEDTIDTSSQNVIDDISETTNKDDILQKIKSMPFSSSRNLFIERTKTLLDQWQAIFDEKMNHDKPESDDTNNDTTDGSSGTADGTIVDDQSDGGATYDPMAMTMLRNKIDSRTKLIERGYNYAVSALVLVDAVLDAYEPKDDTVKRSILQDLIIGTIHYSDLSSIQIYEIIQHVVPELKSTLSSQDEQTCKAPWADLCPPKTIERKKIGTSSSVDVIIPPKAIADAVQQFCEKKQIEPVPNGPGFCTSPTDPDPSTIPSDIPDGSYGYSVVNGRYDDDALDTIFDELLFLSDSSIINEISTLQGALDDIDNEQESISNKIQELKDSIGGDDPTKFGLNGELHAIRDSCFDVTAGKYTYEVCLFKEAKQRDTGTQQGGTGLGRWEGSRIDEITGTRTWKWTNGAKCWNGPERSATVHVTCGKEHKILTAEEPDTCRYVFEMESPIACDDEFRKLHGL